ncbi:MAG: hypothetical protein R3302_06545 [Sulfurimonadaceae bacterium]|nr:hypothetical protein [Sulfurimonadaceae bacterium]
MTDDARTLEALSRPERLFKAVLNLDEERLQVSCRFLKEAGRCEGEAAVILEFSCDENEMGALRNFLNARQIAVIKTVNEFTRSLT